MAYAGRILRLGVREHAIGPILNGMSPPEKALDHPGRDREGGAGRCPARIALGACLSNRNTLLVLLCYFLSSTSFSFSIHLK